MVVAWLAIALGLALLAAFAWWIHASDPGEVADHPPGRPWPTRAGVWVASKGEQRIADALAERGLAFAYEPELAGGLTPDFHLEGTDVLVEYWGMAGDSDYEDRMVEKTEIYEDHGYDVIGLFPHHVGEVGAVLDRELAERGVS